MNLSKRFGVLAFSSSLAISPMGCAKKTIDHCELIENGDEFGPEREENCCPGDEPDYQQMTSEVPEVLGMPDAVICDTIATRIKQTICSADRKWSNTLDESGSKSEEGESTLIYSHTFTDSDNYEIGCSTFSSPELEDLGCDFRNEIKEIYNDFWWYDDGNYKELGLVIVNQNSSMDCGLASAGELSWYGDFEHGYAEIDCGPHISSARYQNIVDQKKGIANQTIQESGF